MAAEKNGCVLCLGFFDGLHLGHQALLQAGLRAAETLGLPLCAHTFDRSPSPFKWALTTLPEREALLKRFGADVVHVTVFDDSTRQMTGDEFFSRIIVQEIGARYVICGRDHRFGHKGGWDAAALEEMCRKKGLGFESVPPFCLDGEKVSSSAIRAALMQDDEKQAERLLGRPVPQMWKQVIQ